MGDAQKILGDVALVAATAGDFGQHVELSELPEVVGGSYVGHTKDAGGRGNAQGRVLEQRVDQLREG